jgi:S1-C subfamily serine protease
MSPRTGAALVAAVLLPACALAAPLAREVRFHPEAASPLPTYVQRIEPSIVGLRVRAAEDAPSSARLGSKRFGSGLVFDARGYAVTVSYLLLDAVAIEAHTRDGRTVPAELAGIDFDTGLGIVKLAGAGPWPEAAFGASRDVVAGTFTGTVGVDEDNDLVHVAGSVQAVRRFSAYWEYMLDRALLVAPGSPAWGGSAVVDERGQVIGIASLRLGEPPHVNLAIPADKFLAVKDELVAAGRVVSRRPRPWLGLYTAAVKGGVVVDGFSESGPARRAGFQKGDRIIRINGVEVRSQEEFYEQLWRRQAGDVIEVAVLRDERVHLIGVRSIDRHALFRTKAR